MSPCARLPCLPTSSRPTDTPLPPPRPVRVASTHPLHQSASRATLRGAQPEPRPANTHATPPSDAKPAKETTKDKRASTTTHDADAKKAKAAKDTKAKDKRNSTASGTGHGKADGGADAEGEGDSLFTDPELVKYLFNPSGKLVPMAAPAGQQGAEKRASGGGYIALPVYHAERAVDAEEERMNRKGDGVQRVQFEGPAGRERDAASVMSGSTAVGSVGGEKGGKGVRKERKGSAWDTMGVIWT